MIDDSDITALRRLIAATTASADGFDIVADAASDEELVTTLRRFGRDRRAALAPLKAQVRAVAVDAAGSGDGVDPPTLVRHDIGFPCSDGLAALAAAEEWLRRQYEEALRKALTAETRRVVEIAYGRIREGHDSLSAMQHACAH